MEKLSGLVLDRYDDVDGALSNTETESFSKIARRLTDEELARLPDETFAVVLHDGDTVLRKFSMADVGNLGLSIEYFMANGHKLPSGAQKVAAANLLKGCSWYNVEPPQWGELQKVALGLNTLIGLTAAPGAVRESKNQLAVAKAAGGNVVTPGQIKSQRLQMGV